MLKSLQIIRICQEATWTYVGTKSLLYHLVYTYEPMSVTYVWRLRTSWRGIPRPSCVGEGNASEGSSRFGREIISFRILGLSMRSRKIELQELLVTLVTC